MNQMKLVNLLLLFCLSLLLSLGLACSGTPENTADSGTNTTSSSVEKAASDNSAKASSAPVSEPLMSEAAHEVFTKKCSSCHGPDGHGIAAQGPDIRQAPSRSVADWEKYLREPQSVVPGSQKKTLAGVSDDDITAMAEYLADLTQHNPPPKQ